MIKALLHPEVQQFILDHEQDDEKNLILKHRAIQGVPIGTIADQLSGRRKAKTKIPLYYNAPKIVYPPGLNLEQSSSEKTAEFKSRILSSTLGENDKIADLTGGFGIDSLFLSRVFKSVDYVEPTQIVLEIAKHNHSILGVNNIEYHHTAAENFVHSSSEKFDCMFIDPSRRDKSNKKLFKLADCEPNVPQLLSNFFQKTDAVFLKTSPLLDIQQGIRELVHVERVWVVSVNNECKELLFFCHNKFEGKPLITAINLQSSQSDFNFSFEEEKESQSKFSVPLSYLYEPNASILKAGAFKLIGENFSLFKLHPSTHLYTSHELKDDFPGRIFKINSFIKPDAKNSDLFSEKANVLTRNYPLSPEELKKKLKVKDGGTSYVIGFSGERQKFVVIADRLK